jgi:glucose dehydrogenase
MKIMIKATLVVVIVGICLILAAIIFNQLDSVDKKTLREFTQQQVAITDQNNWPMFRGGQSLLGTAAGTLPDSLQLLWKFKTGGDIKSSPAINDGLVFIGSADANVYAVDLENGHKVWEYTTGDFVEATPCVVNDCVFVGSSDSFLYALAAFSWAHQTASCMHLTQKPARLSLNMKQIIRYLEPPTGPAHQTAKAPGYLSAVTMIYCIAWILQTAG